MVFDVDQADFEARVVERSRQLPVVVDFWAAWCGPCRALGPALEAAAASREGEVELAKVDVDRNQALAGQFRVQGIPAVKAFKDGGVVDEFVGALPPPQVERFFDGLVASPADRLVETGDEGSLRQALEADPRHVDAGRQLGRLLLERGDVDGARAVLEAFEHDYVAAGLLARAQLSAGGGNGDRATHPSGADLDRAFAAWDAGDHATALELLQGALIAVADPEGRDPVRRVMIAIFTELGADHELAREHRRRLAAALY